MLKFPNLTKYKGLAFLMITHEKNEYVSGDAPIAFSNKFHRKAESRKSFPTDRISSLALRILNEPYI